MVIKRRNFVWMLAATGLVGAGIVETLPPAESSADIGPPVRTRPPTLLPNNISYVSRDATGKIVASQNPDRVGAIASQAKVVMLYSAMNQIEHKFGRGAALQFASTHQKDITEFMSYSNPHDYNNAANRVGRAAAKKLGFSQSEFLATINADIKHISVAGDRVCSTQLGNYTGNGQTTMRDISAIMFIAETRFPEVFTKKYSNNFNPNWTNTEQTFMKPGDLGYKELAGAGVGTTMSSSLAVTRHGGIVAVAVVGGEDQARYAEIKLGAQAALDSLSEADVPTAAAPKRNSPRPWWLVTLRAD